MRALELHYVSGEGVRIVLDTGHVVTLPDEGMRADITISREADIPDMDIPYRRVAPPDTTLQATWYATGFTIQEPDGSAK